MTESTFPGLAMQASAGAIQAAAGAALLGEILDILPEAHSAHRTLSEARELLVQASDTLDLAEKQLRGEANDG
jgi:hypothetical protein